MGYDRLADFDNVKCGAPVYEKTGFRRGKVTGRCGKPLVKNGSLFECYKGKECPDGHLSLTCPKCKAATFAIVPYPRGDHETWIGSYYCRACKTYIGGDEGMDEMAGEAV